MMAAGAARANMPIPAKNTPIKAMTAIATVASFAIDVGGQHGRKGGCGASTNLLPDGLVVAGSSDVRRPEPEPGAALWLRVVLRRPHRRTADRDDARRSHPA